jgi:catalase
VITKRLTVRAPKRFWLFILTLWTPTVIGGVHSAAVTSLLTNRSAGKEDTGWRPSRRRSPYRWRRRRNNIDASHEKSDRPFYKLCISYPSASWLYVVQRAFYTYSWIKADGQIWWVKYHFISDQGIKCLTQDEADLLVSVDGDYHTRDLHKAIKNSDYPSWTQKVQIMPFEDAKTYRINPFDPTKVWPHADYPLIEVGKLVLNRNYTDHHAEIEQAAFAPGNQVPGTGFSLDKMPLARTFAYADAHRARRGVNYKQIPVNAPTAPVHSYSKDGAMRIIPVTDPVYAHNSKGGPQADPARAEEVR